MAGDGAGGGYPLSPPPSTSPQQLRRAIRQARRALTPRQQRDHGVAVANRLRRESLFLRAARIAAYLAADGEIDPMPLLRAALAAGKRCYLPVLHPLGGPSLWFCEWREGDPLVPNRFAIPEPEPWPSMRTATASAWAAAITTVPSPTCTTARTGGDRTSSASRMRFSASTRCRKTHGTFQSME
jgi:hypothetical protein